MNDLDKRGYDDSLPLSLTNDEYRVASRRVFTDVESLLVAVLEGMKIRIILRTVIPIVIYLLYFFRHRIAPSSRGDEDCSH